MGHPAASVTFGIGQTSSDGQFYSRYIKGDRFALRASIQLTKTPSGVIDSRYPNGNDAPTAQGVGMAASATAAGASAKDSSATTARGSGALAAAVAAMAAVSADTQQIVASGVPALSARSLKTLFNPPAVNGDVYIVDKVTRPGGYAVIVNPDGTFRYNASGDESRQVIGVDLVQASNGRSRGRGYVAVNSQQPQLLGGAVNFFGSTKITPFATIDRQLSTQIVDPQGGDLTFELFSGPLPPGLKLARSGRLYGVPTNLGSFPVTIGVRDQYQTLTLVDDVMLIAYLGGGAGATATTVAPGASVGVSAVARGAGVTDSASASAGGAIGGGSATFDYYISPTGSDFNSGSAASPWAITALNTKRSTYRGKRVGLMDGTYNIHAQMEGGYYEAPYLNVDGGPNSGSPTIIQSVNPRAAIINGKSGSLYGSSTGCAMIGHNPDVGGLTNSGYVRFVDLAITGGAVRTLQLGRASGHGTPRFPGLQATGCYFFDNYAPGVPDNKAVVILGSCVGAVVENNYFFQNYGSAPKEADHFSAILGWACSGCSIRKNAIEDSGNIFFKNDRQVGNLCELNYVDMTGWSNATAIQGFYGPVAAGDALTPSEIRNNVLISDNPIDLRGLTGEYWTTGCKIHHNTLIRPGGGSFSVLACAIYSNADLVDFHNNIIVAGGVGFRGYVCMDALAPNLIDYNLYPTAFYCTLLSQGGGGGATITGYNSISAWRAAQPAGAIGKEAHSLTGAPTFTGSGARALAYQLTSGSIGKATGTSDGTTGGTATEMGAWGNSVAGIGHDW